MENNSNRFWDNDRIKDITPAISPDHDGERNKVPIEIIEGALDILRKEEEEDGNGDEDAPTLQ